MSLKLTDALQRTVDSLKKYFPDNILDVYQSSGDTFVLVSANQMADIANHLKNKLHYTYLSDIFGIDRYTSEERFEVVYNLLSLKDRTRIFIKVRCEEENPELNSVSNVWPSASWNEREVYDMFGIHFKNHPDLRRIFLPEDFQYYPLRKEFPLLGIPGSIELPSTTPESE